MVVFYKPILARIRRRVWRILFWHSTKNGRTQQTRELRRSQGSRQKVSFFLMSEVKTLRLSSKKPLHSSNHRRLGRLDHKVEIVSHQTIGMHLPSRLFAHLTQQTKKDLAVPVITENCFPPIPSVHLRDKSPLRIPVLAVSP